jgi:MutS domain V
MIEKEIKLKTLENHTKRLERRITKLKAQSDRYSWLRLLIFVAGAAVTIFGFIVGWWLGTPLLLLFLVIFNVVAFWHAKVDHSVLRHQLMLKHQQTQVARIKLDWQNLPPENSAAPSRREHPFETDIDITGDYSLHRLLDTATTREGSLRLRDWLLITKPNLAETMRRQKLVNELAPLALFRDKLLLKSYLASKDIGELLDGQRLLKWLELNARSKPVWLILLALLGLTVVNIGLILLNIIGILPPLWLISFFGYVVLYNVRAGETANLYYDAYFLSDNLTKIRQVLNFLEKYNYRDNPELKKLCAPLLDPNRKPSKLFGKISWIIVGISLQRSSVVWIPLNAFIPLRFILAHNFGKYKAEIASALPVWLETWFELEALNSLANFAYLNPEYTTPDFNPENNIFEAVQLGHPLIEYDQKICNDFKITQTGDLFIITGSNMAGKSSFLRTLGVNLVLAYAGSRVNADKLSTHPFRLFTCIRVSDSVTDGFSYFYAEVRRLKALLQAVEADEPMPIFFLIDEIFRGTNNRERLIGSQAYLQSLISKNCVGCVSTHDLELVKLADNNPTIQNYHFREDVIDGQMLFDYLLREGASPTTNALKIMKMEGLPVP